MSFDACDISPKKIFLELHQFFDDQNDPWNCYLDLTEFARRFDYSKSEASQDILMRLSAEIENIAEMEFQYISPDGAEEDAILTATTFYVFRIKGGHRWVTDGGVVTNVNLGFWMQRLIRFNPSIFP